MRFSPEVPEPLPRPERPVGVGILTIWNAFSAGFLPALTSILQINNAARQNQGAISLGALCLSVGLPVSVVTAAIGAFMGYDRARVALLVLVTLYYGLDAFGSILPVATGAQTEQLLFGIARALWDGFWIVLNAWYFLRPSTIEFYRRPIIRA